MPPAMRLLAAAALAGLALFVWQTAAHLVTPWTAAAVMPFQEEAPVREAVLERAPASGTYFLPYEEGEATASEPAVFVAVQRDGPLPFPLSMTGQILANVAALLIAGLVLRGAAPARPTGRMGIVLAFGLAGWLVGSVPLYLWWGVGATFVGVELLNILIGWALAAWVLVRVLGVPDERAVGAGDAR